jgi:hypothetical protein
MARKRRLTTDERRAAEAQEAGSTKPSANQPPNPANPADPYPAWIQAGSIDGLHFIDSDIQFQNKQFIRTREGAKNVTSVRSSIRQNRPEEDESFVGDDNVVVGKAPRRMGSRNTIVNATDEHGNVIVNKGPTAIGHRAQADGDGIAIGTEAGASPDLPALLRAFAGQMEEAGDPEAAATTATLIAELESPEPDRNIVGRLWGGIKIAATAHEFAGFIAQAEPLIRHLLS